LWIIGQDHAEGAVGLGLAFGVGGGQRVGDVAELVDEGAQGLLGELDLGGLGTPGGGCRVRGVEGGLGGAAFGLRLGDPVGDEGGVGSGVQGGPVAVQFGVALVSQLRMISCQSLVGAASAVGWWVCWSCSCWWSR
jgi:hypothetical protein